MSVYLLNPPKGKPTTAPEILDFIIAYALKLGASDIHLTINQTSQTGGGESYLLRLRVFGKLQVVKSDFLSNLYKDIVQRVKVLANLNLAESMAPQDGQIKIKTPEGHQVVLRVNTLPGLEHEDFVIRIQKSGDQKHTLDTLQLSTEMRTKLKNLISQKSGLIILNGPAGSGKTTTIYSILGSLSSPERKIITAEDPVEARLPYINHTPVTAKTSFAALAKAFMRQDADIIFIGEIRDQESAEAAIQLAQTGHLVVTTLHTRDAIGVISRLEALEVHPNLIATTLIGSLSQRLVSELCKECRKEYQPDSSTLKKMAKVLPIPNGTKFYQMGPGCQKCSGGIVGRFPIFELFTVDQELSEMINRAQSKAEILAQARAKGMKLLSEDALQMVYDGKLDLRTVYSFIFGLDSIQPLELRVIPSNLTSKAELKKAG